MLTATAAFNGAVLGLWFVSRTLGLPGDDVEAVGLADAIATLLEAGVVVASLAGLAGFADRRIGEGDTSAGVDQTGPRRSVFAAALTTVAASLLAIPAVAAADNHNHESTETTGISSIFAAASHAHGSGGSGNAITDASRGPCKPTAEQMAAADRLVTATTLALHRFRDVDTAVDAGYLPLGFEPNGVHHYLNTALRNDDATLDPERPESILYGRTPTGDLFPVGAMYMMSQVGETGPAVGGCITPWHSHGFPFAAPGQQSVEMMHVWTVALPGGPYAGHVEGEYAQLYLGVAPIDSDGLVDVGIGGQRANVDPLDPRSASDSGAGIATLLNAVNVHREPLCGVPFKSFMTARAGPELVARICDPILNGPLPGATAPPLLQLAGLAGGNGNGNG